MGENNSERSVIGPHQGQRVYTAGLPLDQAKAAIILLHGRRAPTARRVSCCSPRKLDHPAYAYLAPQAAGDTWYPYTFLAPIRNNEPWLTSALSAVGDAVAQVEAAGIADRADRVRRLFPRRLPCLRVRGARRAALRRPAGLQRRPDRLRPVPRGTIPATWTARRFSWAASDHDPHIPKERVEESAEVFERIGASVTKKLYPSIGHTIVPDEIKLAREIVRAVHSQG